MQAAPAEGQQGLSATGRPSQFHAQQPAITPASQNPRASNGLPTEPQPGLSPDAGQGLHRVAPEAGKTASPHTPKWPHVHRLGPLVAMVTPLASVLSDLLSTPQGRTAGKTLKQQPGRGQGSTKNRPPMVAAPAAAGEALLLPVHKHAGRLPLHHRHSSRAHLLVKSLCLWARGSSGYSSCSSIS